MSNEKKIDKKDVRKDNLNWFDKLTSKFIITPEQRKQRIIRKTEKKILKNRIFTEKKLSKLDTQIMNLEFKIKELDSKKDAKKINSLRKKAESKRSLVQDWDLHLQQRAFLSKVLLGIATLGIVMLAISLMILYI